MDAAVDGMYDERAFIFACFGVGLITTLLALMSAAWILMTLEVRPRGNPHFTCLPLRASLSFCIHAQAQIMDV